MTTLAASYEVYKLAGVWALPPSPADYFEFRIPAADLAHASASALNAYLHCLP